MSLIASTASLAGCGKLIGLDDYKKSGRGLGGAGSGGGNSTGGSATGGGSSECTTDQDCDDGISCTIEACEAGKCSNVPDDSLCPVSSCGVSYCDAKLDCQGGSTAVGSSGEMLLNGSFDVAGDTTWYWTSSTTDNQIIVDPTTYNGDPAPSSPNEAWLGGYASESSFLSQDFVVEQGTLSVTISFKYLLVSDGSPYDVDDAGYITLWDGVTTVEDILVWTGADETSSYGTFTKDVDVSALTALGSKTLTLSFSAYIDADTDITSLHVDDVSVVASGAVCPL